MSIKTILVYMANDTDHMARLETGLALARTHQAHLTALYILSPVGMPNAVAGRGASARFIADQKEVALEKSAAIEAEFRARCAREDINLDWFHEDGDHLAQLARHSHYCDLTIVSQTPPHTLEDRLFSELPDQLAMVGSGPALILPHGWQADAPIGRNVVVAWKPCREAARTIHDCRNVLQAADQVTLVTVDPTDEDSATADQMAVWMSRHNMSPHVKPLAKNRGKSVGDALTDYIKDQKADLLVMGAYGHSKMREAILGGATHDMLKTPPVPLLMSH